MKFAFITSRYGAEIGAGPAHACWLLAERVAERHDVEVLTTCARDPLTWKNEYAEGVDRVRRVLVRRFPTSQPHDAAALRRAAERAFAPRAARQDEIEWVRRLGPLSPGLIDFLRRQHRHYDAIVFFSLVDAVTAQGVRIAPERSVLFPHLLLHPALRFGFWQELAASVRAIGYFSDTERTIARAFLRMAPPIEEVVGVGVATPRQQSYPRHQQDPADNPSSDEEMSSSDASAEADAGGGRGVLFRRRQRLYGSFAMYGGRVEPDNGCEEMLEYFDAFAAADGDLSLVLLGVKMMKVPEAPYLRLAGVLPDRERMIAYEAADVTIAPAPSDLLAESVLESFAVGTPVLASAANRAAVDHCRRANAGLYYANREEFVEALRLLTTDTRLREKLGENGRRYVQQHYRWDAVLGRFDRLVSRARGQRAGGSRQ